jgi:uncharacterized protein
MKKIKNYLPSTDLEKIIAHLQNEKNTLLKKPFRERALEVDSSILLESTLIKVVTGPRRSGKSTYALHFLAKAVGRDSFIYMNFDTRELMLQEIDTVTFLNTLKKFGVKYLFLDEVQNLPQFELLLNTLQRNGYKILVSGSNANLLGQELATHLTGRYIQYEMYPFSLHELPRYTLKNAEERGLFPEVALSKISTSLYYRDLFNSVVLKDIVTRYKLRKSQDLYAVAEYIFSNVATHQSFGAIAKKLNISSLSTVSKYLSYLTATYLLLPIRKFSFKRSESLKNPFKYYAIDTGLLQVVTGQNHSQNSGKILENQVLLEIIKAGVPLSSVHYFVSTKNKTEVDFVVALPSRIFFAVQVCVSLVDDKTREREIRALAHVEDELSPRCSGKMKKFIVTKEDEKYDFPEVRVLSIFAFVRELYGSMRSSTKSTRA